MLSKVLPGQPLVELEIAATMACSQGTVREAMLRLQEDGLIVRKGYGGTIVTPVSAVEAKAFLALRAQLESQALVHSLPRIGDEQIEALSALVRQMEAAVIDLLSSYGITARYRADAPGVYVNDAKIAALGLRVKHGCTYHGLSLNVDMDLAPFSAINPCGLPGLAVTQCRDVCLGYSMAQTEQVLTFTLKHAIYT